ncbi:MAG TPA: CPBP family intramembrane glutamic endopeptidase [Paenibacillus sp.]|nr:CPBP family intramembrane glutamic endopeptidase [Paenibacillus sp.]
MKKYDFKNWKNVRFRQADVSKLDDRMLLANVYLTQALILLLGCILLWVQGRSLWTILAWPQGIAPWAWGAGLAAVVLAADGVLSRFVPEDVTDDGGINEKLFGSLPVWHIALLSFVVSVCEEVLFRGAVQHWLTPYWTSILFAALHLRYLRHWLMTGIVFSISYGLGFAAVRTGTIWTPIAAHFIIDFVMGLIIRYRRNDRS